jgi:hypothetical protein
MGLVRRLRVLLDQLLRARTLAALGVFAGLSAAMLLLGRGAAQYEQNLALNLASEFLGAFVILFALTPIVRRAQQGGVREHRRLDFEWYTDRVMAARTTVRVLHTFSRLFAHPYDRRFLKAADALVRRHGRVQILLLDPDSPAAAQRTAELGGHGDVGLQTRRNLRVLDAFRRGLDEGLRRRFEVRLYRAAPSVQIYQWDGRLLASFLPLGRMSGDSVQLEVSVESPLGTFVAERFDELWRQARPIDEYMALRLTVDDGAEAREYTSRFVTVDGRHYVADAEVLAHLARCRDRVVRALLSGQDYTVDIATDEESDVRAVFMEKYDRAEPAFVRLTPR